MNDSSDPDRCDRWWIAGIEQGSILAIPIVAIARIVHAFQIAFIVGCLRRQLFGIFSFISVIKALKCLPGHLKNIECKL